MQLFGPLLFVFFLFVLVICTAVDIFEALVVLCKFLVDADVVRDFEFIFPVGDDGLLSEVFAFDVSLKFE